MWRRITLPGSLQRSERGTHAAHSARRHAVLLVFLLIVAAALPAPAQEAAAPAPPESQAATATPSSIDATPADSPSTDATPATEQAQDPAIAPPQPLQEDPIATDYLRLCAGCHTIGGGPISGPDLLASTRWPREDLRVAVKRMERNTGPMTEEQIDGLTDLLKSPDLVARLDAARERRVQEMAATLDPGDARAGRQLFFGERRFANGGMGCYGCHAAGGRGGNMARDLTMSHTRLGEQSLISATQNPAFPMMVATYGRNPVTAQEAVHIAAFLKETAAATSPEVAAQPAVEELGLAHAGAGGLFLLVLGGVAFLARSRRAGVRARMVRDSFRR
jgi:mono/diheme cytochrome c family protein